MSDNPATGPQPDNDRYRLLVDAITDYAIYMLDPDGRVTSWNAGAERFKGYSAAEIIGENFARFYTEEDRAAGLPALALAEAARTGAFEREGWRLRKDGRRFWAHVIIDPIRSPDGELIGYAKITRDLTERMAARETLLQSQKMEAIGQLTGGVAHDFNNLLMAVLGSLELLRKRLPDDPRAQSLLENAVLGAERGAALTQRMLAFARKQELSPEGVDVAALMHGMSDLLERSLGPSVRLKTSIPEALPPVLTDANQLETALLNLAINARDAMAEGGEIVFEAQAQRLDPDNPLGLPEGDYGVISVTDCGPGMDPVALARATEPFYTTKGVGKGTGLGLSMVHGLAEQSGGRLVLSSQPGQGLRAEIWLPRADAAHVRRAPAPAPSSAADLLAFRPLTILAVDDDALVLTNTAALLEDLGHRVQIAGGADDALKVLERTPVDVVITDQAMPQMTGVQLAAVIADRYPGLPVILASGYAELPAGVDETMPRLAKPYSQPDLVLALQRACAG